MRRFLLFFCVIILLSSCHVGSKAAMTGSGGRNSYNETIQFTGLQQMLLNLVRLRYCDVPFFLDVSNITTQFTMNSFLNPLFPIPGANHSNPIQLGAGISWQNQPTIQYFPVEGKTFANQLMHPIDLTLLQQLFMTGWEIDRIFKITIQSIDDYGNAPLASGPVPEYAPRFKTFFEIANLLRRFQLENQLQIGVKVIPLKNEDGVTFQFQGISLQLSFPIDAQESKHLISLLEGKYKTCKDHYIVDVDLAYSDDAELGIMPRSLLGCMHYLSLGVEVPEEYFINGKAPITRTLDGNPFNWKEMLNGLLNIKSSSTYPKDSFVSIKYKDYWYYIDDRDFDSKKTFTLLQLLYNLQSCNGDGKRQPTLLTIPLGR